MCRSMRPLNTKLRTKLQIFTSWCARVQGARNPVRLTGLSRNGVEKQLSLEKLFSVKYIRQGHDVTILRHPI